MKEIRPQDGNWLANNDGDYHIFSDSVYMPDDGDESVWYEVTDEEKQKLEEEDLAKQAIAEAALAEDEL